MKKLKSILCVALLSVFLTGNAFAGDTTGGGGVFSFFSNVVNAVYSFINDDGDCRPRICQQCRPEERDHDGNCRPTEG